MLENISYVSVLVKSVLEIGWQDITSKGKKQCHIKVCQGKTLMIITSVLSNSIY